MARDVSIQRAETWIYLHDSKDEVEVWTGKGEPPKDGAYFRVKPTPFELVAESLMGAARDAPKGFSDRLDKPSVVMQKIIERTIDDWRGVKHPDTGDLVAFEGIKSVGFLPPMVINLLGGWIYKRIMEQPTGKKDSATTRKTPASSGRRTRGRGAATSATS